MTFLEKLDLLMADQHINKPKLAELSGVPYTTIDAFYKKGYANAKISTIRKIAKALGVTLDYLIEDAPEDKKSPGISAEAIIIAKQYDALDDHGRRVVRAVMDEETVRMTAPAEDGAETKIIPLLGSGFAAGLGDPDFGNPWEDYEVSADSPAEFAVRISGNSMEPYLPDGSIQLAVKRAPRDGEVAALLVDGGFRVKQICEDSFGNLYLFSLNRARADADDTVLNDSGRDVKCFGTILMQRVELP